MEENHSREERQPRAAARPRGSSRQVEQVGEALLLERRLKLVVGSLRLLEHLRSISGRLRESRTLVASPPRPRAHLCVDALLLEQKRPLRHPRIHVAERGAVRRVLLSLLPLESAPTRAAEGCIQRRAWREGGCVGVCVGGGARATGWRGPGPAGARVCGLGQTRLQIVV